MAGASDLTDLTQLSASATQQEQLSSILHSSSVSSGIGDYNSAFYTQSQGDFNQDIPVVDAPSLDSILNDVSWNRDIPNLRAVMHVLLYDSSYFNM